MADESDDGADAGDSREPGASPDEEPIDRDERGGESAAADAAGTDESPDGGDPTDSGDTASDADSSDADTDTDSSDADTDSSDADTDTESELERASDSGSDSESESDTESESESESDTDTDSESDTESDANADADADAESDDEPAPGRREAKTDGEGYVDDLPERDRDEPTYPDPDDDVGGISAPPDDEEMPLSDHIEEMVLRFAVVLLVGSAFTAIGLLWATDAIDFIWYEVFPDGVNEPPHVYHPLELWMTRIKVAALLGIMAGLPMFVYQCYLFMRPGLYPHERRYYLAAVPTSVVLAGVGMLFSFFVVLEVLFRYFTFYAEDSAEIAYALGETFNLIITLTGFMAIVFQIPLFIMLAIMMGVTTRRWLAEKRLYFWAAFFGLAFMFTVDPTMMAPILVALVMILLFEGTLLLLKWVGRE